MTLHVDAVALEEHLAEPSPARLRRQLSSIGVVPSKPSLQRRASYLSTAMGIGTVDPDMHLHPVLVIGMLYFKNPLSLSTLRTVLLERLLQLPRFGSIVVDRGDGADFVPIDKASLDMKYHVSDVPQPQGAWSTSDVDAFLSKLNEPAHAMDTSKPLWRFFQVRLNDGRALLVPVINHAIGDGVALVSALLSILDEPPGGAPPAAAPPSRRTEAPEVPLMSRLRAALIGCFEANAGPFLTADDDSRLKLKNHRAPPDARVCAQSKQVPLAAIKEIKSKFAQASVNDVLMALTTMMLRRYYDEVGEPIPARMRGIFPINLRTETSVKQITKTMGNQFGNGKFAFPMNYTSPVELVRTVKDQVDEIKIKPTPYIEREILGAVTPVLMSSKCGRKLLRDLMLDVFAKCTVMISNVPGPPSAAYLCGQKLEDLMFYAFAPLGVYIGVLSYNGMVSTGICCIPSLEPDAGRIAKHWQPAFSELLEATRQLPVAHIVTAA